MSEMYIVIDLIRHIRISYNIIHFGLGLNSETWAFLEFLSKEDFAYI